MNFIRFNYELVKVDINYLQRILKHTFQDIMMLFLRKFID